MSLPPVRPEHKSRRSTRNAGASLAPKKTPSNHAEPATQSGDSRLFSKDHQLTVATPKNSNPEIRIRRYKRQAEARRLLPDDRVAWCCRKVGVDPETHKRIDALPIKLSNASGNFYTGGHWSCNTKQCPVCSARRAGVYLGRLLAALEANTDRFSFGMDTMTAASKASMTAGEFVPKFKRAMARFCSGMWWDKFRKRWHIRAWVTAQDFTQGDHGPHYHIHRLLIADRSGFYVSSMGALGYWRRLWEDVRIWVPNEHRHEEIWVAKHFNEVLASLMWFEAAPQWQKCCEAEGLISELDYGYHIQGGDPRVARYIAKLALEVTQSGNKRSNGGRNLGELLDDSATGDREAARLWLEAIAALSGTAMLKASKGLWKLIESEEPTSAELEAGDQSDIDRIIALVPVSEWYEILRRDLREEYFTAQAQNSLRSLREFAAKHDVIIAPVVQENGSGGFVEAQGGDYVRRRVDLDALMNGNDVELTMEDLL